MATAPDIEEGDDGCLVAVHAVPGADAPSAAWDPWTGCLRVRVAARAVKGKANAALVSYLSELFGVKASLMAGATSRRKRVFLPGVSRARVLAVAGEG